MTAADRTGRRVLPIAAAAIGLAPVAALVLGVGSSRIGVLAVAIAVAAALHGYGRVVAWLADDETAPLGIVGVWGLAAVLGLAGALVALHAFGRAGRIGLVTAGCVLGARWLSAHADRLVDGARSRITWRTFAAGAAVAAVVGFVVLAAAGNWFGPFVDGETGYLGQLRRLDDTGALGDPIGFPRAAGLGGQIALAALVSPLDLRAAHLIDRGVLFALVVVLAVVAVRRRRGATTLTAVMLPVMLLAIPDFPDDMAPHWSVVAIVLGAALSLERARGLGTRGTALAAVLVAAAALTLRHALAPFAFAIAIAAIHDRRGLWRPAAVVIAIVVVPYIAAAVFARVTAPVEAAFSADVAAGAAARIVPWAVGGLVGGVIVGLALPRSAGGLRTAALAACASLGCAGLLSPTATAAWQVGLPLAIAVVLVVGLALVGEPADDGDLVTRRPPFAAAVIVASLMVGVLPMARFAAGQSALAYQIRAAKMLDDARALGDLPRAEATRVAADYAAAQRAIPDGAAVGLWVDRADLVRYDTGTVVDLRTPSARACLAAAAAGKPQRAACNRLERAAAALPLDYLLVSDPALPPTDPLAVLARLVPTGRVVIERGGVAVIALARE